MLTTIVHGKAGRVQVPGSDSSLSWREVFRRNEDLLTGVLFGRLRFLSSASLCRVMTLLLGPIHAGALGELDEIEFWPKFDKLERRSWVEPDVLMRFTDAWVLMEVKPPFGGSQSVDQWRDEVEALIAEGEKGDLDIPGVLHFVALGNTHRRDGEVEIPLLDAVGDRVIRVHCREWEGLFRETPILADESKGADLAVFLDWLDAFYLFGLVEQPVGGWFALHQWMQDRPFRMVERWAIGLRQAPREPAGDARLPDWTDIARYANRCNLEIPRWM